MPRTMPAFLAGALAAILVVQPVLAWTADAPLPNGGEASAVNADTHQDPCCGASDECDLSAARRAIADRLIELGRSPDEARAAAALLTDADVAVLAENPRMMQAASSNDAYVWGIIGLVVLIGGLITLAILSDSGSISIL